MVYENLNSNLLEELKQVMIYLETFDQTSFEKCFEKMESLQKKSFTDQLNETGDRYHDFGAE